MLVHRSKIVSVLLAGSLASVVSAQSPFLIDPAGGTSLFGVGTDDAVAGLRPLGFTGHFFGDEKTTVDVSSNGNLNFSLDRAYLDNGFPGGAPRIAGMWDDLIVRDGNSVIEKTSAGQYYSVTWQVSTYDYIEVYHQFQVVWFGAAMNIAGNHFQADDIVICWGSVGSGTPSQGLVSGVNKGDGVHWASLPGEGDGLFFNTEFHLLPQYPATGSLLILRPDGAGGYRSILTNGPKECSVDFNGDNFVDFFDYDDFVQTFERGC